MYTITVAPGADVSGGFYSLKAAFCRPARRPHGSRDHPRHAWNLPRKIIPHTPERHDRGRQEHPLSDTVISFGDYGYEIMPDGISAEPSAPTPFRACRRRHATQLNHREYCRRLQNARAGNRTLRRMRPFYRGILPHSRTSGYAFYRSASPGGIRARRLPRADRVRTAHQRQTILSQLLYLRRYRLYFRQCDRLL